MKIGIYSPYLDTLGGGERYMFSIASCFANDNSVHVFWDDPTITARAAAQFHLDLSKVSVVRNFWKNNLVTKLYKTKEYDVIFYLSDGSIPTSLARRTYLHFQFPVNWVNGRGFINQVKLKMITGLLCNSKFTKSYIDKTFGVNSKVIEPGVDISVSVGGKKEKLILSVGRFTNSMNVKKQDFLIESFKKLYDSGVKNWRLVLAGAVMDGDKGIIGRLSSQIGKYPITLVPNIPYIQLRSLYSKASIYWHAAGYGENLTEHPEFAEHFGISTVEAMASGAVPVVYDGGGQSEMVRDGQNGFLWKTPEELLSKTESLISNAAFMVRISERSSEDSKRYSIERFRRQFHDLLST